MAPQQHHRLNGRSGEDDAKAGCVAGGKCKRHQRRAVDCEAMISEINRAFAIVEARVAQRTSVGRRFDGDGCGVVRGKLVRQRTAPAKVR